MINERGISDEKAHAILRRAAEIDRGTAELISIETLRAAAHEAGIAETSFDAALREQSQEGTRELSDAGLRGAACWWERWREWEPQGCFSPASPCLHGSSPDASWPVRRLRAHSQHRPRESGGVGGSSSPAEPA